MRISDWSSAVCSSDPDHGGIDRRQIALDIHDHVVPPAGVDSLDGLEDPVGTGRVVGIGEHGGAARHRHRLHDLPVPGSDDDGAERSEEHTYELQSLMRISYAVFLLKQTQ